MILRPVRPASPSGPPISKQAGRVDEDRVVVVGHPARRQHVGEHALHIVAQLGLAGLVVARACWVETTSAVARDRLAVLVGERDLALGVGLEEVGARRCGGRRPAARGSGANNRASPASGPGVSSQAKPNMMPWSPAPSSLLPLSSTPCAMCGGLAVQVVVEIGILPVEAVLLVADLLDDVARRLLDLVDARRPCRRVHDALAAADLAGEHDAVGGDQRLAGDARLGILGR